MGTTQDYENYFFEMPGYEKPMVEKRIFYLSPIEKKLNVLFENSKAIFWGVEKGGFGGRKNWPPRFSYILGP